MTFYDVKSDIADNLSIVLENQVQQIKRTCDFSSNNLMEMMYTINNAIIKAKLMYTEALDRERIRCLADDDYRS